MAAVQPENNLSQKSTSPAAGDTGLGTGYFDFQCLNGLLGDNIYGDPRLDISDIPRKLGAVAQTVGANVLEFADIAAQLAGVELRKFAGRILGGPDLSE